MYTGTPRKMPAKLAGARRASREDALPYSIAQPRAEEYAAKAAHGRKEETAYKKILSMRPFPNTTIQAKLLSGKWKITELGLVLWPEFVYDG